MAGFSSVETSYHELAAYYDLLINDEAAQERYLSFTKQHAQGKEVLELACGSGTLAAMLQQSCDVHIQASDLSSDMIEVAKETYADLPIEFSCMDMCELEAKNEFDTVLCFCDSLNYVVELERIQQLFERVYDALKVGGVFLFDSHSVTRLEEFKHGYDENYVLDELEYTWHIISEGEFIYQTLRVWDDSVVPTYYFEEKHTQRVYDPVDLIRMLENVGFRVQVKTDFDKDGIQEGEKQFYICLKEE
ncbi:MAG: class I SAM-dependent methyltransferase [Erysipelotrichaceae bacterium]|nr:class I SAM-dependent methyltransferase [Erysipelotrichaceae bacterium]